MKKNIYIAIGSYVLALLVMLIGIPVSASPDTNNLTIAIVTAIFLVIGIIFSLKSNKAKESSWIGSLLGIIGILWLIFTFIVLYLSSMQ
ncbi:MAG: hypothetical protein A3C79_00825 [Candidatus Taylorbacteria bacterium RIFCSPHIGHO2_02_FULL_45_28]|uniref:DUF4190 domain-containing protein n=1 Tax=Candidatus Taylorbacteria bacterium RIFCSPHIGHO2_12_FULL_45_16 TaxID=1802315 RepID=A0A1G2MZF9_9BACT|nr:MAG: hypothetical protein A2830_02075 [Candidatus Taylorbacteria bacterium RIFCSPHIGHO2_01_FULL_44_110]OHA25563.1 MAG: hypothetical protein A3C79_00825 [Candidatus Taylorbacteria bacterium RIFCSPHIGHO2_02_FULL_45_28]OHA29230.1 MAG: hypothetical protein A3F51_01290 [Candidatus Taylorbacteria bacterium RIFCSPHIGHO2_12_FULL_45_16]OHA33452.1 MAG: hypothetical protein A3A23_02170 [Candidatus Taylorbacteria bacterium RIFCSPLOWO2_01_FULL_45_59]OHA39218.1 MAG: hypothetical protein A3I98_02120 [Candi